MRTVAVLFARADSIYKTLPGCDVYDIDRDARTWPGGAPIVAHPPCRAWGMLRHFAKPRPDEKDLARWAVAKIRKWGGVLEHPMGSTLWPDQGLPAPGSVDGWGGFTFHAPQFWWGHPANKATKFYIVGLNPKDMPPVPFVLGEAKFRIGGRQGRARKSRGWKQKPSLPAGFSPEQTPPALAQWLVDLARNCKEPKRTTD